MVYRWNLEGTALEFPTPYAVENSFLAVRGYALIALAVVVAVILALVGDDGATRPVASLEQAQEPASVWPHLLGACLMAMFGALSLVQASRQRSLPLTPGQPASLMPEVAHEATGVGSGAAWLTQAMGRGMVMPTALAGPYAAWLRRLVNDLESAPNTLRDYLAARLAHLLLLVALALVLAAGAVAAPLLAKVAALPMVALVVGLAAAAMLTRDALEPRVAPPLLLALVLTGVVLAAAPLAWYSQALPGRDGWLRLGAPVATAVFLGLALLVEAAAFLAARQHTVMPRPQRVAVQETTVQFDGDPGLLFAEVDRELQRRWAEGIPSRRYARQPPALEATADEGSFSAIVLEESQPLVHGAGRGVAQGRAQAVRGRWLRVLSAVGLAASIAGGLLWVWAARAHMLEPTAGWTSSSLGLVCLFIGGYVRRTGHLLWSRVEVDSTLTWLDFKGSYFRLPGAGPATSTGARAAAVAQLSIEGLTLKACVAQARSVFYAAAIDSWGSRAVVSLDGDDKTAAVWTGLVQSFAGNAARSPAAATPAMLEARRQARQRRTEQADANLMPKRPARFCSACGTPLLVGARFCQQCGSTVSSS